MGHFLLAAAALVLLLQTLLQELEHLVEPVAVVVEIWEIIQLLEPLGLLANFLLRQQ
jgi:hypothetical protein